jgi:hypothetical protein
LEPVEKIFEAFEEDEVDLDPVDYRKFNSLYSVK